MNALDCTDIKALLSALIDDRLDAHSRHQVERHLAGCEACRAMLSEAEHLDAMIAMSAEQDSYRSAELPRGFADAVLAETVRAGVMHERAARGPVARFATWTGWLAAAASIGLAAMIWYADRTSPAPGSMQVAVNDMNRVVESDAPTALAHVETPGLNIDEPSTIRPALTEHHATGPLHRSSVYEGTFASAADLRRITTIPASYSPMLGEPQWLPSVGRSEDLDFLVRDEPAQPLGRWAMRSVPDLSRDEADAIYNISLLMHVLADADLGSFADVERVRRVVEADDLLDLLAELRERVDAEDRPALMAAEAVLVRIVQGPLDREDVRVLRETVAQLDLSHELNSITERWDAAYSL